MSGTFCKDVNRLRPDFLFVVTFFWLWFKMLQDCTQNKYYNWEKSFFLEPEWKYILAFYNVMLNKMLIEYRNFCVFTIFSKLCDRFRNIEGRLNSVRFCKWMKSSWVVRSHLYNLPERERTNGDRHGFNHGELLIDFYKAEVRWNIYCILLFVVAFRKWRV